MTDTTPRTTPWRVLKHPIRVSLHQMGKLERLIAWRMGGNCEGVPCRVSAPNGIL
jgi:hypothetical protein